jgi:hypothetical protein
VQIHPALSSTLDKETLLRELHRAINTDPACSTIPRSD